MRETFVNVYGCDPARVVLIEHGVDLSRFDPRKTDGAAVRAELGLEDKLVIGAISKHFWVKNLDALVDAFHSIAAAREDVHLVVLGIGEAGPLRQRVESLGLSPRVSVLPPRRDVPDVLAAFDLFVHPALAESFGLAIVEAMAMARPVVTTRVGIAADVVTDGVSGIEIPGTDRNAIHAALERALRFHAAWPKLGAEARRRALAFTPQRWVKAHERLYEDGLLRRRP
jgi:glycosyltransferase involved in cell wall biosynthesis